MGDGADGAIPRQRTEDLVVRAHGEETLVLDRRTGTAHCLPAEVTRVWGACTGRNTLAEIASAAEVDEPVAASTVHQLMELDLVEVPSGIDRRKLLRRGALAGAAVAAPVIQSVVAPPAAWAQTPTFTLSFVSQTCSGSTSRDVTFRLTGGTLNTNYTVVVTSDPNRRSGLFYQQGAPPSSQNPINLLTFSDRGIQTITASIYLGTTATGTPIVTNIPVTIPACP